MSFLTNLLYDNMKRRLDASLAKLPPAPPEGGEPLRPDADAELNFIVLGDPQTSSYMHARQAVFAVAARDIAAAEGVYDAAVIVGDVAENGLKCEYRLTADIVNGFSDKVRKVFAVPGNHDVRFAPYRRQVRIFRDFLKSLTAGVPPKGDGYYFSERVNGYKFIMMGSDRPTFEAAYISPEQLAFLDRELAEENGKAVFVFNHQTLRRHNGLPETWLGRGSWRGDVGAQSEKIRRILLKYKNAYLVSGHLHYGASRFTMEDYGAYKSVSAPTCAANNHGEYDKMPQFLTFAVYADRVEVRTRVSAEGRYTEPSRPGGFRSYPVDA